MAKDKKNLIRRDDDLEAVDAELEAAMGTLDGANEKVKTLLDSFGAVRPVTEPFETPAETQGQEISEDSGAADP